MKNILLIFLITLVFSSCKKYLDIVPDNIATIEQAFNMRTTAERYLFTCYSYMPQHSNMSQNPALTAGDEIWLHNNYLMNGWMIAQGFQTVVDPYLNFWQGNRGGTDLYQGIRDCNIFLENVGRVPDLDEFEKSRWIAEAKFLKAYYHYFLAKMYGPIPIKKENLPVNADPETVRVPREHVDTVFNYVVQLLDEAAIDLPDRIAAEATELGRITRPIALSIKAEVLVLAASPLFNGNPNYANFSDKQGRPLFAANVDPQKWVRAREACREAVELCESLGFKLYYYSQSGSQRNVSPEIRTEMNIRNAINERWNAEVIWANTNSMTSNLQIQSTPRGLDPALVAYQHARGNAAVPLKIADMFYTKNGVPIEEDKTWHFNTRFNIQLGTEASKYHIRTGYPTALTNFDREARYYADLGFDGGNWYGQGKFEDNDMWFISSKRGNPAANISPLTTNVTGIWPKKYVNYINVIQQSGYTVQAYAWPVMRLANIHLLYAEALNEADGPSEQIYGLLDSIRTRAGLPGVVEAWGAYSNNPSKPLSKEGLREIIQRERMIELVFEGQRFWDLKRWKLAIEEYNKPITGWDIDQRTPEAYYKERVIHNQSFSTRDYLWPIAESEILANKNTVQNPGW